MLQFSFAAIVLHFNSFLTVTSAWYPERESKLGKEVSDILDWEQFPPRCSLQRPFMYLEVLLTLAIDFDLHGDLPCHAEQVALKSLLDKPLLLLCHP